MSYIRFKSLSVRNFISYGNQDTVFELDEQGTVEVRGENVDRENSSNGSGKTAFINALCYAIYNKAFDQISLQRLVNTTNSIKNTLMEVRLLFEKDGDEYEIYRARGEEYRIEIKKNGEDITPGKGVYETDEIIQEIIGVSYELFTKTIIFSGNAPAFLQQPIAHQRNQIEELFNITILSEKAKLLKERIRETESDIKIAEVVVKQQEVAIELHNKHIREAELRVSKWEEAKVRQIVEIETTLEKIATVDFESEQALHDEKRKLVERGAYLATKLAPLKKDRSILTSKVEALMKEHTHLEGSTCPYCHQQYADAPVKLVAIDAALDENGASLLEIESRLTELEAEDEARKTRLSEVNSAIKHQNLNELIDARTNSALLKQKLDELRVAGNPHTEALDKLKAEKCESVDNSTVDELRRRLDHQQFLLKLLTDKNSFLRRRIINKTIPFLNGRLNHYTKALGLPHIVKFDADMSCTVAEFGRELDFGNLSAGERKRVNTAMSLAFRDVLHHLHSKTNLLIIDELDGALDQSGLDAVIRVIKEKSRDDEMSVFCISHNPAITGRLDKVLTIRKENGFSSIVDD